MKLFPSKLEDAARALRQRIEAAYQARRGKPAPASRPAPPPPAPPPAPAAPAPKAINWELRSQAELVDHIEQHYHAGLRSELPRLIDAARAIERDHAGHAAVPRGLSDLLAGFFASLDSHMMKEERILFPRLRANARGGEIDMPMRMMEREHDDHADELAKIRELTRDLTAPADAPPTWSALYGDLVTLEADLRQHIYLENNVLFLRATGGGDY